MGYKLRESDKKAIKVCVECFDSDDTLSRIYRFIEDTVDVEIAMHDIKKALVNAKIKVNGKN